VAPPQPALELPCGHGFHGACAERWLREEGVCPVCRAKVDPGEGDDPGV
jgi:hypothetical protein